MRSIADMLEVIRSRNQGLRIAPFEDALWPKMQAFLHEHWQADHPLCQRDLFYWQYRGFGPAAGAHNCRLLLDGDEIVGFLGAIPGMYQLDGREVPGVALALWVVAQKYRNTGLGILLMHEVQQQGKVAVCLGVAPSVFKYYQQFGYRLLPALHRYVAPLDNSRYIRLLEKPVNEEIIQHRLSAEAEEPDGIKPVELAALWSAGAGRWRLALSRGPEFWRWRYKEAVGFWYVQFGDARRGAVVARLDRIASTEKPDLDGAPVLRIIEILPVESESSRLGHTQPSGGITKVLAGALSWARAQGAIAADFQCSSTRLEPWLRQVGLQARSPEAPETLLPELFNPLRYTAAPINLMVKANGWTDADFDTAYLVKSDGDMDRPARWPVDLHHNRQA